MEDGDGEGTESAGSDDEVKKGAILIGQLEGLVEFWVRNFVIHGATWFDDFLSGHKLLIWCNY